MFRLFFFTIYNQHLQLLIVSAVGLCPKADQA